MTASVTVPLAVIIFGTAAVFLMAYVLGVLAEKVTKYRPWQLWVAFGISTIIAFKACELYNIWRMLK